MIHTFQGRTANEVWIEAAKKFQSNVDIKSKDSSKGMTSELLHSAFSIADPTQRWLTGRYPAINPAFALIEVIWIMAGSNDAQYLNYWNNKLPMFAGGGNTYHGAYGFRLLKKNGINQLTRAYKALKINPNTRQVVLQIWNARIDMPDTKGKAKSADIPCNITSILKIDEGKLEWTQILRSNDLILGVPYNFNQFTTLQEIIAGWLGVEVGSYNQYSDSLHVYQRDFDKLPKRLTGADITNPDRLGLPFEESKRILRDLFDKVDALRNETNEVIPILESFQGPIAYKNILTVICAEAARKRKLNTIAQEIIEKNTNPCFTQLWDNWVNRWVKSSTLS